MVADGRRGGVGAFWALGRCWHVRGFLGSGGTGNTGHEEEVSMSRRWFWFWLFLSLGKASRFLSMRLNQMEGALPVRTPTLPANAGRVPRRKVSGFSR